MPTSQQVIASMGTIFFKEKKTFSYISAVFCFIFQQNFFWIEFLFSVVGMVLPGCQDTGTAIVMGKKGQYVWTDGEDEKALSLGVYDTYTKTNLRYSQVAPLDMFKEVAFVSLSFLYRPLPTQFHQANTGTNLPAQIDIFATAGNQYKFQFMAKGSEFRTRIRPSK